MKRRLREAVRDIVEKGRPVEQARKLSDEVERLRNELGEMRGRLERVESSAAADGGRQAASRGQAGPAAASPITPGHASRAGGRAERPTERDKPVA